MSANAVNGRVATPDVVRIGGVEKRELVQRLREHRVHLNRAADLLFEDGRFATLIESRLVEIATVSVAELGFDEGATYQQLSKRARESGLEECPLELGPHLRLQFRDQPEGSTGQLVTHHRAPSGAITIASPALDEQEETPRGFYLRRIDGVLWLRGYWSWPGHVWSPEDLLVFAVAGRRGLNAS